MAYYKMLRGANDIVGRVFLTTNKGDSMSVFTCDGGTLKKACTNEVDVGDANPTLVLCAECNHGSVAFNCVDGGSHSCDCAACGPQGWPEVNEPEEPVDGSIPGRSVEEFSFFK
jgi:hypothetical protein